MIADQMADWFNAGRTIDATVRHHSGDFHLPCFGHNLAPDGQPMHPDSQAMVCSFNSYLSEEGWGIRDIWSNLNIRHDRWAGWAVGAFNLRDTVPHFHTETGMARCRLPEAPYRELASQDELKTLGRHYAASVYRYFFETVEVK